MSYKLYTVSITNTRTNATETRAYFSAKVAYSSFRWECELNGYTFRNVMIKDDGSLLIAEAGGGHHKYLIELYENQLTLEKNENNNR